VDGARFAVAQGGAVSARQDRGHAAPVGCQVPVADRVDPAVDGVQPTPSNAQVDGSSSDTDLEQLPTCNDAVLTLGKDRDRPVDLPRLQFTITMNVNSNLDRHGGDGDGRRRTRGLRL
jgi:hypothetical protein